MYLFDPNTNFDDSNITSVVRILRLYLRFLQKFLYIAIECQWNNFWRFCVKTFALSKLSGLHDWFASTISLLVSYILSDVLWDSYNIRFDPGKLIDSDPYKYCKRPSLLTSHAEIPNQYVDDIASEHLHPPCQRRLTMITWNQIFHSNPSGITTYI